MMLEREDLKRLRLPTAIALLLAGIGVAALLYAENRVAQLQTQKKAVHDAFTAANNRLAKVSEEEQEIRTDLGKFRQFTDRKMTGPESRLEWIETLSTIRQQRRLFEVHYSLDRQRPVDYSGIKNPVFQANRMRLGMLLLHENDLLNFLADLSSTSPSFPALRSCTIARAEAATGGGGPLRPRVRAECTVDMITLKAPEKPA